MKKFLKVVLTIVAFPLFVVIVLSAAILAIVAIIFAISGGGLIASSAILSNFVRRFAEILIKKAAKK